MTTWHEDPKKQSNTDLQTMSTSHILQVSQDAVRKLMRHGWNVYPLEAFGFLVGTAAPPSIHAALPTSKTAHWDSHADRWNTLQERCPIADEVATLFGLVVVGSVARNLAGSMGRQEC